MRNGILSIVNALVMITALNGCGPGGENAATADIRQAGVTISTSPVFPYDPLTANQYTLLVSNHTAQEVSLVSSKILNSSLAKSVNLGDIVDTSSCQEIAAGANCSLSVKLPYVKTNGYVDFNLDYQDKLTGNNYSISKLIAFSRDIAESNGMLYSLKYSEKIIVNSDKFTFALPLSLKQDYAKLELQLTGQKTSGYNTINCDSESDYSNHSNCTALVELDSHIAHPKLSLTTTDKNGLKNTINLTLNVEYNNTAHLVYLNAPAVVGATDKAVKVTVVNVGTVTATDVNISQKTPKIDLTLPLTDCNSSLQLNKECTLTYGQKLGATGELGKHEQEVTYSGGSKGIQTDKFWVYRNRALSAPTSIESVYPLNGEEVDNVKPVITVTFSQAVDSDTVNDNTFYLTQDSDTTHLAGSIVFRESSVITFTPTADLIRGRKYMFTLRAGLIGNRAGKVSTNPNAAEVITFTIKQPTITISPDSATDVMMGDNFRFTASINTTTSPTISSVTAKFVDSSGVVGSITPGACALNAGAGTKSCSFTATVDAYSSWNPSLGNGLSSNYKIIVSASGNDIKLVDDSVNFTMNTPTIYLPATGQTKTTPIPATEGMDGWYQAGVRVNQRFTIGTGAEAGCITDNLTGLMWAKDYVAKMKHSDGLNLIDKSNATSGGGFCGHNDWHLPTIVELFSLVNYTHPSQDKWLNTQGFMSMPGYIFWSSTKGFGFDESQRPIWHFDIGDNVKIIAVSKTITGNYFIIPVRRAQLSFAANYPAQIPVTGQTNGVPGSDAGVPWPDPRFVVGRGATANCVTDKLTGLMWVKDLNTVIIKAGINGAATNWQNALDSVKQANSTGGYCGYSDWRLPNINELRSMINYGQYPFVWLNKYFANVKHENAYWSSTTSVAVNDTVWSVSLEKGYISNIAYPENANTFFHVWPVRGGR